MRKLFASLFVIATAVAPLGAQTWQETNNLQSTLSGPFQYSTNGTTATVTYLNQTATNTGATAQHMGMYLGWAWSYNSAGADTPLLWNNGTQKFQGGTVSLGVKRVGFADQYLHLGDVANDSWIGVPWAPSGETPIASLASWNAPLFDFGMMNAGASVNYGIELTFNFSNAQDFNDWDRGGSFFVSAQGVQVVTPEPSTVALLGFALAGLVVVRRKRMS